MSEKFIVRLSEDQIIWLSNHLYKAQVSEEYSYNFWFNFESYYKLIEQLYKTLERFNFKAISILSYLLNKHLDKIAWNSNTDYPDIKASSKHLYSDLVSSEVYEYSPAPIKKILLILEELSVLKILHKGSKAAALRIHLEKFNEFLKRGTECHINAMRRVYEMNNIDFDEIEYLREGA